MMLLGHEKIDNTLINAQLVNFESNNYHSGVAKDVNKVRQLVESGFGYVCDFQDVKLFRKRGISMEKVNTTGEKAKPQALSVVRM